MRSTKFAMGGGAFCLDKGLDKGPDKAIAVSEHHLDRKHSRIYSRDSMECRSWNMEKDGARCTIVKMGRCHDAATGSGCTAQ